MQQRFLFYTFMSIFILTAIVTLLGVIGWISIPDKQLDLLLEAFIIELGAAVVGLFKQTDFFSNQTSGLVSSFGSSIEALDNISDEIVSTINQQPVESNHIHGYLIRRVGNSVVAYQKINVISAEDLERLPKEKRQLIRTHEKSMKKLMKEWEKIKTSGADQLEPEARERSLPYCEKLKVIW